MSRLDAYLKQNDVTRYRVSKVSGLTASSS
jgi:hypothetical protein